MKSILDYLSDNPGTKSFKIANDLNLEKKTVNSFLYGKLSAKVYQNKKYEWFLVGGNNKINDSKISLKQTQLSKLADYFLESTIQDTTRDIRVFAKSKFDYDYAEFRDGFKAELFNPKEWANIFKRSGAKYVVLTSKHHDGYCLWPNKEASESYNMPWNSIESGPKRDLVGDLTSAVKEEGIKMGLYYSIWDWYNPYWTKKQQQIMSSGSLSVDTAAKGGKKSKFSQEEVAAAKA